MTIQKQKPVLIFLIVLLIATVFPPVTAQNLTVTDLGYTGPQVLQFYSAQNGTLLGTWNSTADGISLPDNSDLILIIKPTIWNQDLGATLTTAIGWLVQYWYVLAFVLGAIILATRRW